MSARIPNTRPKPDVVLTDIADYVLDYRVDSNLAYETARNCLIDALGCGLEALAYPACTKLLGPIVPGTVVPNGAKAPGTQFQLDPVQEGDVLGIVRAFVRLQIVAIVERLHDVPVAIRNAQKLPLGEQWGIARAEVREDEARGLVARIREVVNLVLEVSPWCLGRLLQTVAVHVVEPTVVEAAQPAVLDPAVAQVGRPGAEEPVQAPLGER